jgi:small-conductance mechanosensitive channel
MDIKSKREVKKKTKTRDNPQIHKIWLTGYIVGAVGCLVCYFLISFHVIDIFGSYRLLVQRLLLAAFTVLLIFIFTKGLELFIVKKRQSRTAYYNVIRLIRLLSVLVAIIVAATFLFQKWYTAAVSLGLFSLVMGFALQTPISSLIGWFYIIIRTPYKVGDRIQVGTFTGDVVEISYLDTTLWEFGGNYLTNDMPSGRLIRFPNTLVLQSQVYNYSWVKFPYIWNEIPFHVAYESDLDFVQSVIKNVAIKELGEDMLENIKTFKDLVQKTPVDELNIKEYPYVTFRINANTWVEVTVTYLVDPKKAAGARSILIKAILEEFNKQPKKVLFPNSNSR